MSYKFNKDRGIFNNPIELKYIQMPHEVFEIVFRDFNTIPENSRMLALWHFTYHYFTNCGYESLKGKDMNAYLLCDILNSKLGQLQNIARWRCFDDFYKGRDDIDFEMALELANKEKREKRKERNKEDYQRRKDNRTFEERQEQLKKAEKENLKEFIDKHNLGIDVDY